MYKGESLGFNVRFQSFRLLLFLSILWGDLEAEEEFIFRERQAYKNIIVPLERVREVFETIDAAKEEGIFFNEEKIDNSIDGGICSAMALQFAVAYHQLRCECVPEQIEFRSRLQQLSNCNNKEMICRQIAFNTIEVVKGIAGIDYARNKMQSLLNFHQFRIDYASEVVDMQRGNIAKEMKDFIEVLPYGMYVIRILLPADNEKLEVSGHTAIYIKERDMGFLYDPNKGLKILSEDHAAHLFFNFRVTYLMHEVYQVRFYRILEV